MVDGTNRKTLTTFNALTDEKPMTTTIQKPVTITTLITFLGLDGNPIGGLNVRLTIGGQEQLQTTDAKGCITPLQTEAGTQVDIDVQRMDGSYKRIDTDQTGSSNSVWTLTSPSLVLEANTELHQGAAGDASNLIPTWTDEDIGVVEYSEPPVSDAYRDEGHNYVVIAAKAVKNKLANTQHLPDPTRATPPKTGARAPTQSARDELGNPLVVYIEKVKDWWGRWSFPWLHAQNSHAAEKAKVTYSGDMRESVKALIDFAEAQVTYDYSKQEGTAAVYAQMKNGTFKHTKNEKPSPEKGPGRCYQWVRLALARTGITDGYLADEKSTTYSEQESASSAGGPLLRKGFKDVTDQLPDARWAAAGDVIVYRWTDKTWDKRKKSDAKKPNHGHIDIRSYEAYVSDFIPKSKRPNWTDYTNIRIYRKHFDPTPTARIRAFLHCLRDFECQAEKNDSKRYDMLNSALPSNPASKRFVGYKSHPWQGLALPEEFKVGKGSTAAGAYQITRGTWEEMFGLMGSNPADDKDQFDPAVQDRLAVVILENTNFALSKIRIGQIEDAVKSLIGRWSSLPGASDNSSRKSSDGRPMDMMYFKGLFETYFAQEMEREKMQ